MKALAMLVGAVLVGAAVWLSVAADARSLWHDAGWYALVVLAFPAFMLGWYWRDEVRGR